MAWIECFQVNSSRHLDLYKICRQWEECDALRVSFPLKVEVVSNGAQPEVLNNNHVKPVGSD